MIENFPILGVVGSAESLVAAAVARGLAPAESLTAVQNANHLYAASRGGALDRRANPTVATGPQRNAAPPSQAAEQTTNPTRRPEPAAPRHILPSIKSAAFQGPGGAERLRECSEELKARVGLRLGDRNLSAERYLSARGVDIRLAVATEARPEAGGYLTQTPLASAILEQRALAGVMRQLARIFPMTSNSLAVPKEMSGSEFEVYYPNEAEAFPASDLEFGQVQFYAKKRAILSYVSNELRADAPLLNTDFFVRREGHALASREDDEAINGDGGSALGMEVGLLESIGTAGVFSAAASHDSFMELTLADFCGAMALLPGRFANGGESWLCHPSFLPAMFNATGGAVEGFDANGRPRFLGRPVFTTSKFPYSDTASTIGCLYGDFGESIALGDRSLTFAFSDHAAFASDLMAARAVARYDFTVHEGGDATNPGGFVALKTST